MSKRFIYTGGFGINQAISSSSLWFNAADSPTVITSGTNVGTFIDQSPNSYSVISPGSLFQTPTYTDPYIFSSFLTGFYGDFLYKNISDVFLSDTEGEIWVSGKVHIASNNYLFSSAGSSNYFYLAIGFDTSNRLFIEANDVTTYSKVTSDTPVVNDTYYYARITNYGGVWRIYLNGSEVTLTVLNSNSGKWFGDIPNRNNMYLLGLDNADGTFASDNNYLNKLLYFPSPTNTSLIENYISNPTN
jgi:hypothetical protein